MPKIADYYAEMKKVVFLFSALIICTALFGAQYQITFYKISAELKGEVTPELVKQCFDKAVSDGKYELLAQTTFASDTSASATNSTQIRFPEKYDDNLKPCDFTAYDVGFVSEFTLNDKNGKIELVINARFTTQEWEALACPKYEIRQPKFTVSEIRTSMSPKIGAPYLLFPRSEKDKTFLFIMVLNKVSED